MTKIRERQDETQEKSQLCTITPNKFKTATLKLLPKPSTDPHNPINYKLISLLEVPEKVLEKNQQRIRNYTEPYTQHWFRDNRGTDTPLKRIFETLAHHTTNREYVYLVLRGISKAFDKVQYAGLQYKKHNLQPSRNNDMTNNFIQNRKAKTKITPTLQYDIAKTVQNIHCQHTTTSSARMLKYPICNPYHANNNLPWQIQTIYGEQDKLNKKYEIYFITKINRR